MIIGVLTSLPRVSRLLAGQVHGYTCKRLAEQYVGELAAMAKNSNMLIVPDKPNDITGVLATAMSLGKTVTADAQGAGTARFS